MIDNGVSIYGTKEVDKLKPIVERYDTWRDKGAGVDISMDRQAYPEKPYDASDKIFTPRRHRQTVFMTFIRRTLSKRKLHLTTKLLNTTLQHLIPNVLTNLNTQAGNAI